MSGKPGYNTDEIACCLIAVVCFIKLAKPRFQIMYEKLMLVIKKVISNILALFYS